MLNYYNKETPEYNSFAKRNNSSLMKPPLSCDPPMRGNVLGFTVIPDWGYRGKKKQKLQDKGFSKKLVRWKFNFFCSCHLVITEFHDQTLPQAAWRMQRLTGHLYAKEQLRLDLEDKTAAFHGVSRFYSRFLLSRLKT